MNKLESKYFNTAVKMDEALISLLVKKDFAYITVKEICEIAKVNRSTFYLHYETIGDLLAETVDYIMSRFDAKFKPNSTIRGEQIEKISVDKLILITPDYLIPYLEFVKENRRIFKVVVSQPTVIPTVNIFNNFYEKIFYPIMKRFGLEEYEINYKLTFYLNGMFALISEWIKNDCSEDVNTMAKLIIGCVFPEKDGEL